MNWSIQDFLPVFMRAFIHYILQPVATFIEIKKELLMKSLSSIPVFLSP